MTRVLSADDIYRERETKQEEAHQKIVGTALHHINTKLRDEWQEGGEVVISVKNMSNVVGVIISQDLLEEIEEAIREKGWKVELKGRKRSPRKITAILISQN